MGRSMRRLVSLEGFDRELGSLSRLSEKPPISRSLSRKIGRTESEEGGEFRRSRIDDTRRWEGTSRPRSMVDVAGMGRTSRSRLDELMSRSSESVERLERARVRASTPTRLDSSLSQVSSILDRLRGRAPSPSPSVVPSSTSYTSRLHDYRSALLDDDKPGSLHSSLHSSLSNLSLSTVDPYRSSFLDSLPGSSSKRKVAIHETKFSRAEDILKTAAHRDPYVKSTLSRDENKAEIEQRQKIGDIEGQNNDSATGSSKTNFRRMNSNFDTVSRNDGPTPNVREQKPYRRHNTMSTVSETAATELDSSSYRRKSSLNLNASYDRNSNLFEKGLSKYNVSEKNSKVNASGNKIPVNSKMRHFSLASENNSSSEFLSRLPSYSTSSIDRNRLENILKKNTCATSSIKSGECDRLNQKISGEVFTQKNSSFVENISPVDKRSISLDEVSNEHKFCSETGSSFTSNSCVLDENTSTQPKKTEVISDLNAENDTKESELLQSVLNMQYEVEKDGRLASVSDSAELSKQNPSAKDISNFISDSHSKEISNNKSNLYGETCKNIESSEQLNSDVKLNSFSSKLEENYLEERKFSSNSILKNNSEFTVEGESAELNLSSKANIKESGSNKIIEAPLKSKKSCLEKSFQVNSKKKTLVSKIDSDVKVMNSGNSSKSSSKNSEEKEASRESGLEMISIAPFSTQPVHEKITSNASSEKLSNLNFKKMEEKLMESSVPALGDMKLLKNHSETDQHESLNSDIEFSRDEVSIAATSDEKKNFSETLSTKSNKLILSESFPMDTKRKSDMLLNNDSISNVVDTRTSKSKFGCNSKGDNFTLMDQLPIEEISCNSKGSILAGTVLKNSAAKSDLPSQDSDSVSCSSVGASHSVLNKIGISAKKTLKKNSICGSTPGCEKDDSLGETKLKKKTSNAKESKPSLKSTSKSSVNSVQNLGKETKAANLNRDSNNILSSTDKNETLNLTSNSVNEVSTLKENSSTLTKEKKTKKVKSQTESKIAKKVFKKSKDSSEVNSTVCMNGNLSNGMIDGSSVGVNDNSTLEKCDSVNPGNIQSVGSKEYNKDISVDLIECEITGSIKREILETSSKSTKLNERKKWNRNSVGSIDFYQTPDQAAMIPCNLSQSWTESGNNDIALKPKNTRLENFDVKSCSSESILRPKKYLPKDTNLSLKQTTDSNTKSLKEDSTKCSTTNYLNDKKLSLISDPFYKTIGIGGSEKTCLAGDFQGEKESTFSDLKITKRGSLSKKTESVSCSSSISPKVEVSKAQVVIGSESLQPFTTEPLSKSMVKMDKKYCVNDDKNKSGLENTYSAHLTSNLRCNALSTERVVEPDSSSASISESIINESSSSLILSSTIKSKHSNASNSFERDISDCISVKGTDQPGTKGKPVKFAKYTPSLEGKRNKRGNVMDLVSSMEVRDSKQKVEKSVMEKYLESGPEEKESRVERTIRSLRETSKVREDSFSESRLLKRAVSLEELSEPMLPRAARASSLRPEDSNFRDIRRASQVVSQTQQLANPTAVSTSADISPENSLSEDQVSQRIKRKSFYLRFNNSPKTHSKLPKRYF